MTVPVSADGCGYLLRMPLADGTTFAGYTILRLLGSGGMGEVYLAQHPRLPRRDALKLLPPDGRPTRFRARFIREADLASTLWHPHIVGVHDRGEADGQLWISMDFVDGLDAARLLADRYPAGMPLDEVVRIVTAVAGALDYAHKQGLLHRDVKPANIMLTHLDDDGEQRILFADFGIARDVDDISGLTATNMTVGTVAYSAPEQLMGRRFDGRADQYALAATAYHLLTGSQLFPHSNPAVVISRHLNATPPLLADTRAELADLDPYWRQRWPRTPATASPAAPTSPAHWQASRPISAAVSPTAQARPAPAPDRATPPKPAKSDVAKNPQTWLTPAVIAALLLLLAGVVLVWRPWSSREVPIPSRTSSTVAPSTVPTSTGELEHGRVSPTVNTLVVLAAALGGLRGRPVALPDLMEHDGYIALTSSPAVKPAALQKIPGR